MNFIDIERKIDDYIDGVIALRRDIHSYPELANNEFETSKKILSYLECESLVIKKKLKLEL